MNFKCEDREAFEFHTNYGVIYLKLKYMRNRNDLNMLQICHQLL